MTRVADQGFVSTILGTNKEKGRSSQNLSVGFAQAVLGTVALNSTTHDSLDLTCSERVVRDIGLGVGVEVGGGRRGTRLGKGGSSLSSVDSSFPVCAQAELLLCWARFLLTCHCVFGVH